MRKKGFKIVAERWECLINLTDLKQDLLLTYSMSNTQESSGGNHKILSIDEAFEKKALESMVWSREQIRIEH